MNISGIRPSEGIYSYNSIEIRALRNQQIAAAEEAKKQLQLEAESATKQPEFVVQPLEQNYNSYDFAQEYKAGQTYELKGVDSDINKLDLEEALSDMEKDKVLQQYQYFVGSDALQGVRHSNNAEQVLRSGENFIL